MKTRILVPSLKELTVEEIKELSAKSRVAKLPNLTEVEHELEWEMETNPDLESLGIDFRLCG